MRAAVKLPKGVHHVKSHGKDFYYFRPGRKRGAPKGIRLPDDPRTPEFWAALQRAQGKHGADEPANTTNAAIDAYLAAVKPTVEASTHYQYTRTLKIARAAWGSLPVAGIEPIHIGAVMRGLSSTPAKANGFLAAMKQLSAWLRPNRLISQSMVEGIRPYKLKGGHKPWTPEQLAAAEKNFKGMMRRGFVLYRYTGQRGSDVVRLGPTYIDEGGFNLAQKKTGREVWCPILPELAAEMQGWERRTGPYLLQGSGRPYSRKAFWAHFDEARAGIPELADVTLHGLRCTAVINLRRHGLSTAQIGDIVGMSIKTIERYCRFANRKESGRAALVMMDRNRTDKERKEK